MKAGFEFIFVEIGALKVDERLAEFIMIL